MECQIFQTGSLRRRSDGEGFRGRLQAAINSDYEYCVDDITVYYKSFGFYALLIPIVIYSGGCMCISNRGDEEVLHDIKTRWKRRISVSVSLHLFPLGICAFPSYYSLNIL